MPPRRGERLAEALSNGIPEAAMSLAKYRKKRDFRKTPEPTGNVRKGVGGLRFVVQKHKASRLHYDFRLELDGALKSWAVPKGPSLNPEDKRLAMQVEDHPLEYRTFEGIIPPGNYGAGTVMVWDQGTYHPTGAESRAAAETQARDGLSRGRLHIVLDGSKLRGEFILVRLRKAEENAWLLRKVADAGASERPVVDLDRSVLTDRTLEQIAQEAEGEAAVWTSRKARPSLDLDDAPKAAFPDAVRPMLAKLVKEPFDRSGWIFEIKWDGYRVVAFVNEKGVRLVSRNQLAFGRRFEPIEKALAALGREAVLDGEAVVLDEAGRSRFQLMQNYQKTGQGRLVYYAFDLLYLDGRDLTPLPLLRRKELLKQVIAGLPSVYLSEHVEERGISFYRAAEAQELEGIVAKRADSPYREGSRSDDWLKIKPRQRQEAVIAGFTEPRRSRMGLGAVLLGVYEGNDLIYIGHTGGGLGGPALADLEKRLKPLVQRKCPFQTEPTPNAPVHWVRPKLVCEVAFQEWTESGVMRQPIFLGLRDDKAAKDVHREKAEPIAPEHPAPDNETGAPSRRRASASPSKDGAQPDDTFLTNLDKIYFPEDGYTKGDVIAYYRLVAPVMLPYLRDRPMSLHRHPNGINGKSFFQKDTRGQTPNWVQTVEVASTSTSRSIAYLVCQDLPSLLYVANLGCIEINPWNSTIHNLDRPDYLILDLDPEDLDFQRVIEVALTVRRTLDQASIPSFCKTSGKRGLHICVPLAARYEYDLVVQFARVCAMAVHRQLPDITSLVRSPSRRQKRVYIDFLQNRRGQTLAAPYSVRPIRGGLVSTPLSWTEVRRNLDPSKFTLKTVPKRLDRRGDLWDGILGEGIDIQNALDRLSGDL